MNLLSFDQKIQQSDDPRLSPLLKGTGALALRERREPCRQNAQRCVPRHIRVFIRRMDYPPFFRALELQPKLLPVSLRLHPPPSQQGDAVDLHSRATALAFNLDASHSQILVVNHWAHKLHEFPRSMDFSRSAIQF